MCLDKVVTEGNDIVDRELGGGVRLKHCGVVDMFTLLRYGCLDGEELNVDVGHIHSRELNGKASDVGRLDSELVYKAGDLNAGICGEVINKTLVEHVTADLIGLVRNDRFHDPGSILVGSLVRNVIREIFLLVAVPTVDLMDTAAGILVKRDTVTLDELGVLLLDKEAVILRIVLARLGAVVSESADIFESDKILEVFGRVLEDLICAAADLGVEVVAVGILKLKEECHMVDARDLFLDGTLGIKSYFLKQGIRADLNAVAETYGLDGGISLHISRKDRHGVGIVEEESLGADLSHITGEIYYGYTTSSQKTVPINAYLRDTIVPISTWYGPNATLLTYTVTLTYVNVSALPADIVPVGGTPTYTVKGTNIRWKNASDTYTDEYKYYDATCQFATNTTSNKDVATNIVPVIRGGTGTSAPVHATSGIFTANSDNATKRSEQAAVWGKVATVNICIRLKTALSTGSGNISNITVGTLAEGYRPAYNTSVIIPEVGGAVNINANGSVNIGSFLPNLTIATTTDLYIRGTYILA